MDELETNIYNVTVEISATQCLRIHFVVLGYVCNLLVHTLSALCISFIASGVGLSPLYCGHFWPIVPAPDDR
jgi:hypothetical protein